ncbi:hypothetical protein [Desulfoluna spongiiphila]|uniref:hypothetical protein n=1 Tax=Desulfoluna spongiiphila TaxID=419481 RepID=UPI001114506E|nr:hypothetical protein [Desulfoluna spongiiphila]
MNIDTAGPVICRAELALGGGILKAFGLIGILVCCLGLPAAEHKKSGKMQVKNIFPPGNHWKGCERVLIAVFLCG